MVAMTDVKGLRFTEPFLITRMCTLGTHEVSDCRLGGGCFGSDEVECGSIVRCLDDGMVRELSLEWIGWCVVYFTFEHDVMAREKGVRNITLLYGGHENVWLKDVVHIADHVVLSVLDFHIVAEMRTQGVHCDELKSDGDAVSTAADLIFLDGGALEAPESHLRAVRPPASFFGNELGYCSAHAV